jgi:iron-sulfur cluster assembly accessory protein
MAIKLTAKANVEIKKIMAEVKADGSCPADAEVVLRIGIVGASCSGVQYGIGLEDVKNVTSEDVVNEEDGVKIAVWDQHNHLLDGTEIDYDENGFSINNPNVPQGGCHGCCHKGGCSPEEGKENENPTD